jgi:SPP1 gp7 family putative phage head morphogenesis protein
MARKTPDRPAADPRALDEAVQWFRDRLIMDDEEFQVLEDVTHDQAFTLAGVAQLDLVTEVWEALDRAVAHGETLRDFQARVSDRLAAAWGMERPWRVETIYRNNVQRAYSAGRWQQMNEPAIKAARPFRRFSAILDLRTTTLCRGLDGTVRPADDPWWDTHCPPLHHQCRSAVVTLSKSEAGDAPLPPPPDIPPAEGFGSAPALEGWEPDLGEYPAELAQRFRRTGT